MATNITDIVNGLKTQILVVVPTWLELPYTIDVAKNNYREQSDRYGVIADAQPETDTVTKYITFTGAFQVVLTKGYYESNLDDSEQLQSGLDLRETMLDIFKQFVNTKGGTPGTVLNITNLSQGVVEYLTEEKVAVLRSTIDITYRLSLI